MEIGFSIGSNLDDRLANLRAARQRMVVLPGVRLLASAPIYETEPVDVQPDFLHLSFLNTVLILTGELPPVEWRRHIAQIEAELGRVRTADRFAPRTIDIDLLFAGDLCLDDGGLIIPHPRWAQRRFVLQPLADVRPNLILPGVTQTVSQLLATLPSGEAVTKFCNSW